MITDKRYSADKRYRELKKETDRLVVRVQEHLQAHAAKQAEDKKNWGYVGDLEHYRNLLNQILGVE